jgi:hypothetical protein
MVRLFRAKAQLFERHWNPRWIGLGVAMLRLWALSRMAAMGAASAISHKYVASYDSWREIWRRRGEYVRDRRDGDRSGGAAFVRPSDA